jgi:hypothetical protein
VVIDSNDNNNNSNNSVLFHTIVLTISSINITEQNHSKCKYVDIFTHNVGSII